MNKKGQVSPKISLIVAGLAILFFSLTGINDLSLKLIGSLAGGFLIWKGIM